MYSEISRLDRVQAWLALALLGLALPSLARAWWRSSRVLAPSWDGSAKVTVLAVAIAAVLRWLVAPRWIVTMYVGYRLTREAVDLFPVAYYGVSAPALYHTLFGFLPRDHATVLWANSIMGVLTLPLLAALGTRWCHDRRTGSVFVWLLALTPLFIKNDNSDANNIPCLLWLYGGLVLWDEWLESGRASVLVPSAALLALAATARPEMPVLLPLYVAAGVLTVGAPRARWMRWQTGVFLVALAVLLTPQLLHVRFELDELANRGGAPRVGFSLLGVLPQLFFAQNTVLRPTLYPVALVALAVSATVLGPRNERRGPIVIALLCFPVIAIYFSDLCRANMARVHVPGAQLVTLLAAHGAVRVWERGRHVAARGALGVAIVASAVPTALVLWAPTNEQTEERLIRAALATIPRQQSFVLVRVGWTDRVRESAAGSFTHQHFPDYLFEPPNRAGAVRAIADWQADPDWSRPAYFYVGMRCYAQWRPAGTPPPRGENVLPACETMRRRFTLEPLIERTVDNRGDVWLEYYGDASRLRLGLYRIRPR